MSKEKMIVFTYFNSSLAYQIGHYLAEKSMNESIKLCINIYAYNKCLFHFSSDLTTPDNDNWLRRKRNAVLHFSDSSKNLYEKLNGDQTLIKSKYGLDLSDYSIIKGGYPIIIENSGCVGAICVSGQSPDQDHDLVLEAISYCMNRGEKDAKRSCN